jgi:hypothetical protein
MLSKEDKKYTKPVKKPLILNGYTFDEKTYLERSKLNVIFTAKCDVCNREI